MKTVIPTPNLEPPPAAPKLQFGIRHLLELTTYVALIVALTTWKWPGTLMVAGGLGSALLSHFGAFQRLQKGKAQLVLVGLAWITFLVSLVTPCITGPFSALGWAAAWLYLTTPVAALFEANYHIEPYAWPWIACVDLSNVLQALLPLHCWRLAVGRGQVLSALSCLAMVGPWTTIIMASDLYVAYYIWCASFMLLVIAVRVSRVTLLGMIGIAMVQVAIFRVSNLSP